MPLRNTLYSLATTCFLATSIYCCFNGLKSDQEYQTHLTNQPRYTESVLAAKVETEMSLVGALASATGMCLMRSQLRRED